ncbi:hypothetical protein KJ865_17600, partial [Myxococcota bacterium]|nr:hypothetical protein [Myxococcota bacterium]
MVLLSSCGDWEGDGHYPRTVDDLCPGDAPPATLNQGVCAGAIQICTQNGDGSWSWADPSFSDIPGYETNELSCDGLDNNCDGSTDEPFPTLGASCGTDVGTCVSGTNICNGTQDGVECSGSVGPVPEVCDGLDNDCDGVNDNGIATLNWYPDVDGDTYGDMTAAPVANCANPGGMVNDNTDCNDAAAAINPAAT